jgi:hypothetical protein
MGPKRRKVFETELVPATTTPVFLYHVSGRKADGISVSKEIRNGKPVFLVWTALDTVNVEYTKTGQLKPYGYQHKTFDDALKVVRKLESDAIASGRWVTLAELNARKAAKV